MERVRGFDQLDLKPTADGSDPRDRGPWASVAFADEAGEPIVEGMVMKQYFVTATDEPVLTSDGQPVHVRFDDAGQPKYDDDGMPIVTTVEVPPGSRLG
jgi:hypothetical protein